MGRSKRKSKSRRYNKSVSRGGEGKHCRADAKLTELSSEELELARLDAELSTLSSRQESGVVIARLSEEGGNPALLSAKQTPMTGVLEELMGGGNPALLSAKRTPMTGVLEELMGGGNPALLSAKQRSEAKTWVGRVLRRVLGRAQKGGNLGRAEEFVLNTKFDPGAMLKEKRGGHNPAEGSH